MTLYELHQKDVIQMKTGENLGRIDDLVFAAAAGGTATVQRVVLRGRPRWFGLFGRGEDLEITWQDIKQVGADVVLVDTPALPDHTEKGRRWRW